MSFLSHLLGSWHVLLFCLCSVEEHSCHSDLSTKPLWLPHFIRHLLQCFTHSKAGWKLIADLFQWSFNGNINQWNDFILVQLEEFRSLLKFSQQTYLICLMADLAYKTPNTKHIIHFIIFFSYLIDWGYTFVQTSEDFNMQVLRWCSYFCSKVLLLLPDSGRTIRLTRFHSVLPAVSISLNRKSF